MGTYEIETRRDPENSITGGLRQEWISAGPHDDEDGPAFESVELDCGAGLGSPWLHFRITFEDGKTVRETADIRPMFEAWVSKMRAEHGGAEEVAEQTVTVPAEMLRSLANGVDKLADELHERAEDNIHPNDRQALVNESDGWRAAARLAYEIVDDQ